MGQHIIQGLWGEVQTLAADAKPQQHGRQLGNEFGFFRSRSLSQWLVLYVNSTAAGMSCYLKLLCQILVEESDRSAADSTAYLHLSNLCTVQAAKNKLEQYSYMLRLAASRHNRHNIARTAVSYWSCLMCAVPLIPPNSLAPHSKHTSKLADSWQTTSSRLT